MGCGVFPIYGLEHSKGVESSAQFSDDDSDQHSKADIDELQNQAIGAEVRDSTNENEMTSNNFLCPQRRGGGLE
jgi:hypothetical protein